MKQKAIAVYCGAATGNDPAYEAVTVKLAKWIVTHNFKLVYGGGGVGLMGLLARTVLANKGQVLGIMPQTLVNRGASLPALQDLEIVADMSTRKRKMIINSDVCIALPGGPGTLEEISEAFSWARLGSNTSPCIFLNISHYYDPLEKLFDEMVAKGFLTKEDRDKLLFTDSFVKILDFIDNYVPPKVRTY